MYDLPEQQDHEIDTYHMSHLDLVVVFLVLELVVRRFFLLDGCVDGCGSYVPPWIDGKAFVQID